MTKVFLNELQKVTEIPRKTKTGSRLKMEPVVLGM